MMHRFAGDNKIMQQMAVDLERQSEEDKQRLEKFKQLSDQEIKRDLAAIDEQTQRNVAAAYGVIIPFS